MGRARRFLAGHGWSPVQTLQNALPHTAGCVCTAAPLWCGLGGCSRTVAVNKASTKRPAGRGRPGRPGSPRLRLEGPAHGQGAAVGCRQLHAPASSPCPHAQPSLLCGSTSTRALPSRSPYIAVGYRHGHSARSRPAGGPKVECSPDACLCGLVCGQDKPCPWTAALYLVSVFMAPLWFGHRQAAWSPSRAAE